MVEKKTAQTGGNGWDGADGKVSINVNERFQCSTPARPAQPPAPVFVHLQGRIIGEIRGDTFTSYRQAERHMLRTPPAWALDAAVLRALAERGVTRVVIVAADWRLTFTAPLAAFFAQGFAFNRGHGQQVGLKLGYWHAELVGAAAFKQACAQARQLTLDDLWHEVSR